MRSKLLFTMLAGCLALTLPGAARGQESTPSFELPLVFTFDDVEDLSVDFDTAFQAIDNPYLADSMKLNYQISLLEKMVSRQGELEKISETYQSMGVPFNEPPPARGICAQLPANAPCLKAYPDLYSGLVNERKTYYADMAAKMMVSETGFTNNEDAASAEAARKRADAERKAKEAVKERRDRYQWTEVTCRGSDCFGVLVSTRQPGYRATVRKGMRLADGTLVQNVSANGVRVVISGESIHVRPASADDNSAKSAQDGDSPIADVLKTLDSEQGGGSSLPRKDTGTMGASKAATSSAIANAQAATQKANASVGASATPSSNAASATTGPSAASGQTMAEPSLGPSGLF